jgi:hypothetical protein
LSSPTPFWPADAASNGYSIDRDVNTMPAALLLFPRDLICRTGTIKILSGQKRCNREKDRFTAAKSRAWMFGQRLLSACNLASRRSRASAPYSGASGIEEGLQRYGRRDALASYVQFVVSGHRP